METRAIIERIIVKFKETIPDMVKNLLANFVDSSLDEENFSVNRLKQLQEKQLPENIDSSNQLLGESVIESQSGVVHWCGNGDRFMTQEVRQHDQLSGVSAMFEIDPMANLPEESEYFKPID